jgi:hypothetical protein
MIPIACRPEPADFDHTVRQKGHAFLQQNPHPTSHELEQHSFWRAALPALREQYGDICAYCALWIPPCTGAPTVDHYIPKTTKPAQAYEWRNFRLASSRMNSRKQAFQDVLDPFKLKPDWFILDFPSLSVRANPALSAAQAARVNATIKRLRLNHDGCDGAHEAREYWLLEFCKAYEKTGRPALPDFYAKAPFIAYELERQGLLDSIVALMKQIYPALTKNR